jgi:hypothetical protein
MDEAPSFPRDSRPQPARKEHLIADPTVSFERVGFPLEIAPWLGSVDFLAD